jgi:hypothetical protein
LYEGGDFMKIQKITVALLTLLIVSLCGSGNIMAVDPQDFCPPLPEAFEALISDDDVIVREVEVEEWEEGSNFYYAFEPKKTDPKIGFILLPGAFVDISAYAPPAHAIAVEGFLTVLIQMNGGLALGNKNLTRADKVMSDYPGIEKWIIGGHSMGGSGACKYAKDFAENVVGVVLWASYPTEIFRIDDKELKAISIYGSLNLNIDNFPASEEHLPPDTPFVIIEGGNHYQFGFYDASLCPEEMDRTPADITREEQQDQIIQATLGFLEQFDTSSFTTTTIPAISCPAELLYGENSEEVELLRYLRDTIISTTPEGQEIIKLYYLLSPVIVKALKEDGELKEEGKALIDGILLLIRGEKE